MIKNNQKSKNGNGREITIDDLALMVASGFKEVYEIMGNGFKETHKIIDDRVSGLKEAMIPPHEFEDLSGRVGYIEDKLGIESGK